MGFFDKVKSMKNALTGGAAKVYVDTETPVMGQPFKVTVRAQSQGAEVKFDRVYLNVRGQEEVSVPDVDVVYDEDGDANRKTETVHASCTTFEQEMTVTSGGSIDANGSEEWTIEVTIPENAQPQYQGRYTRHYYEVYAGLDCFGNDPDSGWVQINF
jgi:hypothetical protein